jgi:hypothetical protein
MSQIDQLRNGIIDRILAITDRKYLNRIEEFISQETPNSARRSLTKEQKMMLELSLADIEKGALISQEDLDRYDYAHLLKC